MDIRRLVEGAKDGDKEAFRDIFEHLSNRLFAYAYSRTSNRDDAMDIVQETFIDLWKALENFEYETEEKFYGFVFIITKRKLNRYYISYKTHRTYAQDEAKTAYNMKIEDYRYLLKHIDSLALKYKDLLRLRYWADMTFGEIAYALNIKEATAKVWHHRAIKKLKFLMQKYDVTF